MKERKVISSKNIPVSYPFRTTVIAWLVLDRLQPADWIWTTVFTLIGLLWIFCYLIKQNQRAIELFTEEETPIDEQRPSKKTFKERLSEKQRE